MITDRGELTDAISRWLLRDNTDLVVTQDQIENYVDMAEAELRRELKIRDLQETVTISTVADTAGYDLPADWNSLFDGYFETPPFDMDYYPTKKALITKFYGATPGRPQGYTIFGSQIIFGPTPDAAYDIVLDYYARIPALTADDDVNIILEKHPDAYLYGALKQAQMQIMDAERLQAYGGNFATIVARINADDQEGRIPVGARPRGPKPIGGR